MPRQMRRFLRMMTRSLAAKLSVAQCCRHLYWAKKQVPLPCAFLVEKTRAALKLTRLALQHRSMIGANCNAGELARAAFRQIAKFTIATQLSGTNIGRKSCWRSR